MQVPDTIDGTVTAVALHYEHACALRTDQTIACWGRNDGGQAQPPAGTFSAVSVGHGHTCGVRTDQSIVCWGGDAEGQAPAGLYTAVAAGVGHTCAIRVDKTIACWGSNASGQAGAFTSLAAGASHNCAIRTDGSLTCWGRNSEGQAPRSVPGPFVAVAAGNYNTCALRTDQTIRCWGDVGIPILPAELRPAPPDGFPGKAYSHRFFANDPNREEPVSFDFSHSGQLPDGLSLSAGGVMSGVPTKRGSFPFAVSARNLFGVATAEVTIDVLTDGLDVNADGWPDLAVGAPGEDEGRVVDAGAVTVLFGAPDGTFGRAGSVKIAQEAVGQSSEKGDRFGAAIAVGDILGDANLDLIIGAPGENNGAGQVVVIEGSFEGMTGARRTVLRQGLNAAAGAAEAGDNFGAAVSVGAGGALWVGAPGEDYGSITNAGVATHFLTRPLRPTGSVQYHQGGRGIPGVAERGDRFGASLGGGGAAIGAPGEDVGSIVDAGLVTWRLTHAITQNSPDIPGTAEAGDQFGAAVAFTTMLSVHEESGEPDAMDLLAAGAPGEDIGSLNDAGFVILIGDYGFNPDFDLPEESLVQSTWSAGQRVEAGDRFGASVLLAAKTTEVEPEWGGDELQTITEARLVVGAPGEDIGSITNAGIVTSVPTWASCIDGCTPQLEEATTLRQGSSGVAGVAAPGNTFGATLTQLPGNGLGIAIGAPGQTVDNHPSAGAVSVINPPFDSQEIHQNSTGVAGSAETGDRFSTLPRP